MQWTIRGRWRPPGPVRTCQRARRNARRSGDRRTYVVGPLCGRLEVVTPARPSRRRGGHYDARSPTAPDLRGLSTRRRSQVGCSRRGAPLYSAHTNRCRHLPHPVLSKDGVPRPPTAGRRPPRELEAGTRPTRWRTRTDRGPPTKVFQRWSTRPTGMISFMTLAGVALRVPRLFYRVRWATMDYESPSSGRGL